MTRSMCSRSSCSREGAKQPRHLGRRGIAHAGHDGVSAPRSGGRHPNRREPDDIRSRRDWRSPGERAELVAELGDLARGELRHQHRDFEHDGPQPHRMLVALDVELACRVVPERQQFIEARLQAVSSRNMYSEHGLLRGSVPTPGRCASRSPWCGTVGRDRRRPRRRGRSSPTGRALQGLGDLAGPGAPEQVPVAVRFDRLEELVGDPHRVVGVLAETVR